MRIGLLRSTSLSRRSGGVLLLVGVLAGVTVGGGVGVIAASSTKSVTVCVDKKDNHMNYSKDSKCKSHQYKLVLNQQGIAGAKGDTGAAGAKGDAGSAGAKGDTGTAGAKGDTGAAGAKGDAGSAGAKGDTGTAGAKGDVGEAGTNATVAITQQSVCDGSDADTVANEVCKIGMTGPGGGHIFFVDYNDQYLGLNYLEAAPSSCEGAGKKWSSDTDNSLIAVGGWAARAVGSGQANTKAMMTSSGSYVADISEAAFYSDSLNCGGKSDWFLGSLGEMKLMYDNLQGSGDFAYGYYWTSSENIAGYAWIQNFIIGYQYVSIKSLTFFVRPVRAF